MHSSRTTPIAQVAMLGAQVPKATMLATPPSTGGVALAVGAVYTTGLVRKKAHLCTLFQSVAMGAFQEETARPVILPVPPLPFKFNGLMSPVLPGFKEVEEDGGGLKDEGHPRLNTGEAMGAGPELLLLLASLYGP